MYIHIYILHAVAAVSYATKIYTPPPINVRSV